MKDEVPHFVSTDVVNIESGLSIGGGRSESSLLDAAAASASYAEIVNANRRTLQLLGLDVDSTEDILITTEVLYVLIRMLGPEYYHGLALSRKGNLGLARAVMKKYESALRQFVGALSIAIDPVDRRPSRVSRPEIRPA
jgi:predicted regulator of Ras-like GTPase activity (Roadblock/LC7/MglB family)